MTDEMKLLYGILHGIKFYGFTVAGRAVNNY